MAGGEPAPALAAAGRLDGGGAGLGPAAHRRFQHRRQRGRRLFPRQPAQRLADEHRQGVSAHGDGAGAEGRDAGAYAAADHRGRARGRRGIPAARRREIGARGGGGDPLRRGGQLPSDPAAERDRSRGAPAGARHRGDPRCTADRREPAGPSATALRLASAGGADAEHAQQLSDGQGADRAGICAQALRSDGDGAQPAGGLHQVPARSGDGGPRISRPAPDAGGLRSAAA